MPTIEIILDLLNFHKQFRIRQLSQAVKKATEERRVAYISAHPCEFQGEYDFDKLGYLLGHVLEETSKGGVRPVGMSHLARIVIDQ